MFHLITKAFSKKNEYHDQERDRLRKVSRSQKSSEQAKNQAGLRRTSERQLATNSLFKSNSVGEQVRLSQIAKMTGLSIPGSSKLSGQSSELGATDNFKHWISGR